MRGNGWRSGCRRMPLCRSCWLGGARGKATHVVLAVLVLLWLCRCLPWASKCVHTSICPRIFSIFLSPSVPAVASSSFKPRHATEPHLSDLMDRTHWEKIRRRNAKLQLFCIRDVLPRAQATQLLEAHLPPPQPTLPPKMGHPTFHSPRPHYFTHSTATTTPCCAPPPTNYGKSLHAHPNHLSNSPPKRRSPTQKRHHTTLRGAFPAPLPKVCFAYPKHVFPFLLFVCEMKRNLQSSPVPWSCFSNMSPPLFPFLLLVAR